MAVPTFLGSTDTVQAGDLLLWWLPAADPQPYTGATLHGEGLNEKGQLVRVWWAYATRAEIGLWPCPDDVVRGYVVDDGSGSSVPARGGASTSRDLDARYSASEALAELDAARARVAEMQPGRWWRVLTIDGEVWCETSSEGEARRSLTSCPSGGVLQRLYERTDREWRAVEADR